MPDHPPMTSTQRRQLYACADCTIDTDRAGEFAYMVHDRVWRAALRRARRDGMEVSVFDLCCIRCLEARLGRELTYQDFDWNIPLNVTESFRSERLRRSMAREP